MNRRQFLEMLSTFTGTSLLMGSMPWMDVLAQPLASSGAASDRVRIGFIGTGLRGRALMLNLLPLAELGAVEIAAVCDTYAPHLERGLQLAGGTARAYDDHRRMLDEGGLDAVIIATPLHQHVQPTLDAFQSGLHVFVEKAMARTLPDVKRMYDAHLDAGRVLQVGHQRMFSPVYLQGLDMIRQGRIGTVTMLRACWMRNTDWLYYKVPEGRGSAEDRRLNWRLYWDSSAGQVTELGTHHFQIANWVLGSEPLSVKGSGSLNHFRDGREVHDNFSTLFEYPDGIRFSYDCLQSNKHNGVSFQVLGTEGTLELESNKLFLETPPEPPAIRKLIHSIESGLFETIPIGGATWIPAEPVTYGGEYISGDYQLNDTQLSLEAFVGFVRNGTAPEELSRQGYLASVWSLLAEEATRTGATLTLPDAYRI